MPLEPKQNPPYYEITDGPLPAGTKIYIALLNQDGTNAPVATVIRNTFGAPIVWTRTGEGFYLGTLAAAFPVAKTSVLIANTSGQLCSGNNNEAGEPSNSVYLDTGIDGALYLSTVQIYVYP